MGRYEEAGAAYRRAIELDPKNARPWNGLGNLLKDHFGRCDEAEAAFHRAIELDPLDARSWNGLGCLLTDFLGRFSDAEQAFEHVRQLDPTAESPLANLIFLHRDFQSGLAVARSLFAELSRLTRLECKDSYYLHEALFAAYDTNWGIAREKLRLALEQVAAAFRPTTGDDWMRATAVLLHLDYGKDLLALLEERGDDPLRPWYKAIRPPFDGSALPAQRRGGGPAGGGVLL